MIRARYLHRSGYHLTNINANSPRSTQPLKKFYSAVAGASSRHDLARNHPLRTSELWKSRQWPLQQLNSNFAPRFASTAPNPPPTAEGDPPTDVPPPEASNSAEGELVLPPLDEMTSPISPPVYEHLGFLKEMGLDYGWGPTAFVETMLEHVHVYLGTPWWASIGITVLIFRAALFRVYLNAADTTPRLQLIKHLKKTNRERLKAARIQQDISALQQARIDTQVLHKSAGINAWASLLPMLQIPIGFGTFRLLRGMATLPVPGFDTGGLLWISDLTTSDPYYVLPVITACVYHFTFKFGGESSNSALVSPLMKQFLAYGFPVLGGLFMIWFPAGLQLTFCLTTMVSCTQAYLFNSPWFRNLTGMQPLPNPATTPNPTTTRYQAPSSNNNTPKPPAGLLGKLKASYSEFEEQYSSAAPGKGAKDRLTDAEKRHAKTYEQRRQKELKQEAEMNRSAAQDRFEREQERLARDQERKEAMQRRAAEKKARRRQ